MDAAAIVAPIALALCGVLLATAAATETALERASDVRIQALAARGDERARRIAGSVEQPRQFLGPLTAARILFAAAIVAIAAYLGAREYRRLGGAIGFGLIGGVVVELIEMTVGLIVARQPEVAALKLSGVARMYGVVFSVPAFLSACRHASSPVRLASSHHAPTSTSSPWSSARRPPAAWRSRNDA